MPLIETLRQEEERESGELAKGEEKPKSTSARYFSVILSLLLPALLMIQFNQRDNAELGSLTVNASVALYTITSFLLRRSVTHAKITNALVSLMPEWIALLASGLAFNQYKIIGFLTMTFGMTLMSLVIVKESFRMLRASEKQVKKAGEPTEVDILVV